MPKKLELFGRWLRISARKGTLPDQLIFEDNGLYRGKMDEPGTYTDLDVGTFQVGSGVVRMSTANDAVKPFRIRIEGSELILKDEAGNTIRYKRN